MKRSAPVLGCSKFLSPGCLEIAAQFALQPVAASETSAPRTQNYPSIKIAF
jgi:hypothetical protein